MTHTSHTLPMLLLTAFALSFAFAPLAFASEVTGQLNSNGSVSSVPTGGSGGSGGGHSGGVLSGTVTGGTLGTSQRSEEQTNTAAFQTTPTVLGVATLDAVDSNVFSGSSLTDGESVILAENTAIEVAQAMDGEAAIAAADIPANSWMWAWLLLPLVLLAIITAWYYMYPQRKVIKNNQF